MTYPIGQLQLYPPSFWRHKVRVRPKTNPTDASLGPVATPDPVGRIVIANVQDRPLDRRLRDQEFVDDAVQSNRPFKVLFPTDPVITAEDQVDWLAADMTTVKAVLTAQAPPTDRTGAGVLWVGDFISIT